MKIFVISLLTFLLGVSAAYGLLNLQSGLSGTVKTEDTDCFAGDLIAEQVCDEPVISKSEYADLRLRLESYIEDEKQKGTVSEVGIFFRDLKDGPTLGINEYADFSAASLLKVPGLIAYLAVSEENPEVMSVKLRVPSDVDIESFYEQYYQPRERIVPGQEYTVSDLLKRSIDFSDNLAHAMLVTYLQTSKQGDLYVETLRDLGLVPGNVGLDFVMSVKRYSSIFRTLYVASYLSPKKSEEALEILSKADFHAGLRAGVPPSIRVAQKFGERAYSNPLNLERNVNQLHDCGIIYFPDNPYTLCIMTRGDDFKELEGIITDLSRMFYEEVESRRVVE
jgi:beta-lactamase class A